MSYRLFASSPALPGPRYPHTAKQADLIAMAQRVATVADAHAAAHDRDASFPTEAFAAMGATPLVGLTVPEQYGGMGASPLETMLVIEQLAQGDASMALIATMHFGHVAGVGIHPDWPNHLRDQFLREVVTSHALYNTAASEPGMGSPSRGGAYATTAIHQADGWHISGRKSWSTGSTGLRWAGVACSVEDEPGTPVRATFLVPMDAPGVRIEETWDNLGMRASSSHDIVLDDVVVPHDHRLPASGKPDGSPWSILTSALYLGIGVAARNWAIAYAQDRRPTALGGKAIAELEGVQAKIAQMELLLLASRSSLYGSVEEWETYPAVREQMAAQLAAAKVIATNNAIEITDLAMRIVGSVGMQRAHPLERYFRDARAGLGNPPIDDVAYGMIARSVLTQ
jgi:alkylation response protein AidB-like acyl-CoA dehydrogenase